MFEIDWYINFLSCFSNWFFCGGNIEIDICLFFVMVLSLGMNFGYIELVRVSKLFFEKVLKDIENFWVLIINL